MRKPVTSEPQLNKMAMKTNKNKCSKITSKVPVICLRKEIQKLR